MGVEARDAHRQVVRDLAQEAFAVGQPLLEQLALRRVLQRADDAARLAALELQAAHGAQGKAARPGARRRGLSRHQFTARM